MRAKEMKSKFLNKFLEPANEGSIMDLRNKIFNEELDGLLFQYCKEQRKICDEDMRFDDNGNVIDDSIINAKMPEV